MKDVESNVEGGFVTSSLGSSLSCSMGRERGLGMKLGGFVATWQSLVAVLPKKTKIYFTTGVVIHRAHKGWHKGGRNGGFSYNNTWRR